MNAQPFLQPKHLKTAYDASLRYMRIAHTPLNEYERIANNKPHPAVKDPYPKNTDGTVAGLIQDQPRRTIQQIPTGKIDSPDERKWLSIVTNYYVNDVLVPKMRAQAEPLQKCWAVGSKCLTFGFQPTMTMLVGSGDDLHADFKLPDVRAILFEAGKLSFQDCNYYFIVSYYQISDIDAIIRQTKAAKKQGIDTGWNTNVLKAAKKEVQKKKSEDKSYDENAANLDTEGVLIVHAYQYGVHAEQYSFIPALAEHDDNTDVLARVKVNKDPRGVPPVQGLYANVTLNSPLGRGIVELSGGMQNFIDSSMQMYQYTQALMLDPPLKKRGTFLKSNVKYRLGHVIDMGTDEKADVEPLKIETSALENFNNIYQLAKSQIIALNSSSDTSIGADVGNPGMSKTPEGIKASQAQLGIADNHFRKQLEDWWQEVITSAVNIEFNEKSGKQTITLDKDTAQQLVQAYPDDPTVEGMFDEESRNFTIDFDTITKVPFYFTVDASSSQKEDNQHQLDALNGLNQQIDTSPAMTQLMQQHPDKLAALWNAMVSASGIENPEKLSFSEDDVQQQQEQLQQQQAQQQQMQQQGIGPDGKPTPQAQAALQTQAAQQQQQSQALQAQAQQAQGEQKMAMEAQKHQQSMEAAAQSHRQQLEAAAIQANQQQQMAEQKHQQGMEASQTANDAKMAQMGVKPAKKPSDTSTKSKNIDTSAATSKQPLNSADTSLPNMDGKVEPNETKGLSKDEMGVIDALFKHEFPEPLIEQAILMMRQGVPPEDIVPKLTELVQSQQGQA